MEERLSRPVVADGGLLLTTESATQGSRSAFSKADIRRFRYPASRGASVNAPQLPSLNYLVRTQ